MDRRTFAKTILSVGAYATLPNWMRSFPAHNLNPSAPRKYFNLVEPPGYHCETMPEPKVLQLKGGDYKGAATFLIDTAGDDLLKAQLEYLQSKAVKKKLTSLFSQIAPLIADSQNGCLLRVNKLRGPEDIHHIADPFVTLVGCARQPYLALADAGPGALRKKVGNEIREYLWCTMQLERMTIECPPVAVAEYLEERARQELMRRTIRGSYGVESIDQAMQQQARAEVWRNFAMERLQAVADEAGRARIQSLNARFEDSERRLRRAESDYRNAMKQLASEARRQEASQKISTIISLVQSGMKISSDFRAAKNDSISQERWHAKQMELLEKIRIDSKTDFRATLEQLNQLDGDLRSEWSRMGAAAIPDSWIAPPLLH